MVISGIRQRNQHGIRSILFAFLIVAAVMLVSVPLAAVEVDAAGGVIVFDDGRTFTDFKGAFNAVSSGDNVTMTITGGSVDASDGTEKTATLTKNAKVTIQADGNEVTINGYVGVDGAGTLIVGNDSSGTINVNGGIFADNGTLETHSELVITTVADDYDSASIRIGNYYTLGSVTASINGGTINSDEIGILVQDSGSKVKFIRNCTINASSGSRTVNAIYVRKGSEVEEISGTTIKVGGTDTYGYGIRVNAGKVGTIDNADIEVKKSEANGISVTTGGRIDSVINSKINVDGRRSFPFTITKSSVGKIEKCKMDVKATAMTYGLYIQPGALDYLKNTDINVTINGSGMAFCVYQQGPVKEVSGCTFAASGTSTSICGYNVLNTKLYASSEYPPRLDVMKNNKIHALSYALAVQQDAELGVLSGNHFYAEGANLGCIYLSVGGVIEDIKSGTYASKGSGVYINYGTSPGPSGVYNSTLKKISYEETEIGGKTVKQGPVFYGETGWAIMANTKGPAPNINVEKDQVEADQPLRGYARYFGGAAKVGGLGNGDAIIGSGTQDRDVSKDTYPTYSDQAAGGTASDPKEYLYFMSRKGTDNAVSDDDLKDFAGFDITGKTFHYLTVNARLRYDPNDDDKDPKVTDPKAMDGDKILDEYNTSHQIAQNKYDREFHTFKEWNTKKDGSGTSYKYSASGDSTINLENASTILYAIWNRAALKPVDTGMTGSKTLSGDKKTEDIAKGDFVFRLVADSTNPDSFDTKEVEVEAGGKIDFGTLKFTKEGSYTFRITERDLGIKGYTYDDGIVEYTVKVKLNENTNVLEIDGDPLIKKGGKVVDGIRFDNKYKTPNEDHTPVDQGKKNDPGKGSATGDATDPLPLILLMLASGGAVAALTSRRRRGN